MNRPNYYSNQCLKDIHNRSEELEAGKTTWPIVPNKCNLMRVWKKDCRNKLIKNDPIIVNKTNIKITEFKSLNNILKMCTF